MDSYAEIKSAPSVAYVTNSGRVQRKMPKSDVVPIQWRNQIWQSLEEGAGKAMLGVWDNDCVRTSGVLGFPASL